MFILSLPLDIGPLCRTADVRRALGGVSKPTIIRLIRKGLLPQPVRVSRSLHLYSSEEVNQALAVLSIRLPEDFEKKGKR